MKRSIFLLVLAVCLWPTLVRAQGSREVDLRPRFSVGQSLRYKLEMNSTSESVAPRTPPPKNGTRPEPPEKSTSKVEYTFSLKTQSVGPTGEATVNLVFEAVKMSTTNKDGTIEFDSSKPSGEDDLMAGLLKPLVGSTLTMKIDRAGNISSITGGEAFSAIGQFTGGAGGGGNLFGQILTSRKSTGLARVGEAWETADKIETGLLRQFDMRTKYTLASATFGDARVNFTGRIPPGTEASSAAGGAVKDASYSGSFAWDTERGCLKRMDSTLRARMETTVDGAKSESKNEAVLRVVQVR